MPIAMENINYLWSSLIVEELVRNGITYFCLSPGSRSAPLAVAAARHPDTRVSVCLDERGSAFHALGYAQGAGKAAVVITTSGTALANTFPAIVEASMAQIPLLILSADRPPELRDSGANQTIDQVKFFGNYCRWSVDLPCPTVEISPQVVLTTVNLAIRNAYAPNAGPVHLNCMFREPLAPVESNIRGDYLDGVSKWKLSRLPFTQNCNPVLVPGTKIIDEAVNIINRSERGIIVVGDCGGYIQQQAVIMLASYLEWPVLADITSGLKSWTSLPAENNKNYIINNFHQMLASDQLPSPDTVLHLGGPIISKSFDQFCRAVGFNNYIHVSNSCARTDHNHFVSLKIDCEIDVFCRELKGHNYFISCHHVKKRLDLSVINHLQQKIDTKVDNFLEETDKITEPFVARAVTGNIKENSGLFLGNSMPIRDCDLFYNPRGQRVIIGCNRGASGIDGNIAAASGFAVGLQKATTLLIGDLAFIHDSNSLKILGNSDFPVTIVLINNCGGGIFSFLPISECKEVFESCFASPHKTDFKNLALAFGLDYQLVNKKEDFVSVFVQNQEREKSTIIEVQTNRQENYSIHKELHRIVLEQM